MEFLILMAQTKVAKLSSMIDQIYLLMLMIKYYNKGKKLDYMIPAQLIPSPT